jgi:hypothetical protein
MSTKSNTIGLVTSSPHYQVVRIVTMNLRFINFLLVIEYTHYADGTQTRRQWCEYFK